MRYVTNLLSAHVTAWCPRLCPGQAAALLVGKVQKVPAMSSKLSVLVQVDLDGRHVAIQVTGALTVVSQQGLHPLIRRGRGLSPGIGVTVDLSVLSSAEPEGLRSLQDAVTDPGLTRRGGEVRVVLPVIAGSIPASRAGGFGGFGGSVGLVAGGERPSRPAWSSTVAGAVAA